MTAAVPADPTPRKPASRLKRVYKLGLNAILAVGAVQAYLAATTSAGADPVAAGIEIWAWTLVAAFGWFGGYVAIATAFRLIRQIWR